MHKEFGAAIVFSPELELVIAEVLPRNDPFGNPDFDAVDYINREFPNEHSLGNLDSKIQELKTNIKQLDEDILVAVRQQSTAGSKAKQDLAEGKTAMQELFAKIKMIREKSEQSEAVVQEIGRDIKVLDYAKRHLVTTITTLKRFNNLASAVEQLDGMASRRQYREAGSRLEAVNGLCQHFESFTNVPRVNELRENVERMKSFLRRQVLEEFNSLGAEGPENASAATLKDACEVVNALGPDTRQDVVLKVCTQQLAPYQQLFKPPAEASALDKTEQRYKWLRKQVKVFEEQYGKIFPMSWNMSRALCLEFCSITRKHLIVVLDEMRNTVDVSLLIRVLQRTIDFEHELAQKFGYARHGHKPSGDDDSGGPVTDDASADGDDSRRRTTRLESETVAAAVAGGSENVVFRGAISSCFEPYMQPYLNLVEQNLQKKLAELLKEEKWVLPDDRAAATNKILNSSSELFLCIKSSLKECITFTRNATLFNMSKIFKKYLKSYCDALAAKLPRPSSGPANLLTEKEEHVRLMEKDEQTVCLIINTADYCFETSGQLGESIKKAIDKQFGDSIDMSPEQEEFSAVITKAVRILVLGIETKIQVALDAMTKMPWASIEGVGDQSHYITTIANILTSSVNTFASLLSETHFRFFSDKLVASLIPRYMISIYRCKRINNMGAQQLQVDSHAFKTILLQIHPTAKHEIPASYHKYVDKEMGKVDTLLKVILSPPEGLADTYWKLIPDGTPADFAKILELKGLKSTGIKLPTLSNLPPIIKPGKAPASGPARPSHTISLTGLSRKDSDLSSVIGGGGAPSSDRYNTPNGRVPTIVSTSASPNPSSSDKFSFSIPGWKKDSPSSASQGSSSTATRQQGGSLGSTPASNSAALSPSSSSAFVPAVTSSLMQSQPAPTVSQHPPLLKTGSLGNIARPFASTGQSSQNVAPGSGAAAAKFVSFFKKDRTDQPGGGGGGGQSCTCRWRR
mmetsp:Transcript_7164/g.11810  ORF Transcript_7164/g.11810 Transcript_7164/m.11810 type:complete len:972 (-) Transcript_7164:1024-3939(-)